MLVIQARDNQIYPADRCSWTQDPDVDGGYFIHDCTFWDGVSASGVPLSRPLLGTLGKSGRFVAFTNQFISEFTGISIVDVAGNDTVRLQFNDVETAEDAAFFYSRLSMRVFAFNSTVYTYQPDTDSGLNFTVAPNTTNDFVDIQLRNGTTILEFGTTDPQATGTIDIFYRDDENRVESTHINLR